MRYTLIFLFASLTGQLHASSSLSSDTVYYAYVKKGTVFGTEWVYQKDRNNLYYHYDFNDRGRGPSVNGHVTVDEKGVVTAADFTGVDYYKATVDEHFFVSGGKAHWKNKFENDSAAFHGELYSDMNGPVSLDELRVRMLQA